MDQVKTFSSETLSIVAMVEVGHQLPLNARQIQTVLCIFTCVFITFLADGLNNEFVRLDQECATLADKYLKFRLKWHQHCSYYLVDCNHELSLIGLHPNDSIAVDVVSVRSQWHCVVKQYSLTKDDSKIFLILFCSYVYDELLHTYHSAIEVSQPTAQLLSEDSDDVYYHCYIKYAAQQIYTNLVLCITTKREYHWSSAFCRN